MALSQTPVIVNKTLTVDQVSVFQMYVSLIVTKCSPQVNTLIIATALLTLNAYSTNAMITDVHLIAILLQLESSKILMIFVHAHLIVNVLLIIVLLQMFANHLATYNIQEAVILMDVSVQEIVSVNQPIVIQIRAILTAIPLRLQDS